MTSFNNPPHDIDAEKTVLACSLVKKENMLGLMENEKDIFYLEDHRRIFQIMRELYEAGQDIDLTVLAARINDTHDERLKEIIPSLINGYTINYNYLLNGLVLLMHKRRLIETAKDLFNAVMSGKVEYMDFLDKIVQIAADINKPSEKEYCTIADLSTADLDELFQTGSYVQTGFPSLDERIIGLFKGQLVIIAGRPGLGKSTFALNIADNTGLETLLFSLEMKRTEIYARILSKHALVEAWKIEGKKLERSEAFEVHKAHIDVKDKIKITLFDSGQNFARIVSNINKFVELKKPQLIIIDYLQLIKGAQGENQNIRIGNITGALKNLAMQLNVPIILLSQLSRDSEKERRRPTLSDLRDSGNIEQDADVVIFIHEEENINEIIVAKSRKGKKGKILSISFDKPYSRFVDSGCNYAAPYGECRD